jgi:predicted ATPase/DNA-binding winged helix-turn-helix (wHTH) protein
MIGPSDLTAPGMFAFGPFRMSVTQRLIERSGEPLQLGGRALDILIALVERAGDVVSQRELIDLVWPNVSVDDGNLRYHVATLRRALYDGVNGARYIINVPGRGYCFVSPVAPAPHASSGPAVGSTSPGQGIPSRLERMVGREAEVEFIAAQLMSRRFVTIVGPGGIGKTTVAVSVGHAVAEAYSEVCFLDLSPLADPRLVPSSLAMALGVGVQSDNPIPGLIAFLRDKRMLLILDSCEHVIGTAAAVAEAIFEQADGVHVLATSREALRIEGEQVHRLAPLECPPLSDALTASESLRFSAARLFAERVAATSDRFVFQDGHAPVVARICRKLDGIALAIELAAGRVDAHGVDVVAALLDSKLSLLWQGRRTATPRHQTLNATLDWSYNLLADQERVIVRRLVVFAGAFTLEAAQAVVRDGGVGDGEVAETVASLVAKSLVVSETDGGRVRYRLLDTTRAYLQDKLAEVGEADAVARRHASFFCGVLRQVGTVGPAVFAVGGHKAYGEHLGNVRAALDWSFSAQGDAELGVALAVAAMPLFLKMSLLTECRRWAEKALTAPQAAADPRGEMELRAALGLSLMFTEGNREPVHDALNRALVLAEELGERGAQLRLMGALHQFHTRIGDFRGSVGVAARAMALASEMADPAEQTVAEWLLGTSEHFAGDQSSALIHCRGALPRPVAAPRSDTGCLGFDHRIHTLCALARAQWLCGAADEAADVARYAVAEAQALNHPVTLCISRIHAVFVFLWRGDHSDAAAIIEDLLSDTAKHSLAPYHAVALGQKGELALRRGDTAAAIALLSGSLPIMRSGRHETLTSVFSSDLAQALAMSGRLEEALATVSEALCHVEARGGSFDMPEMLRLKGDLLARQSVSNTLAAEACLSRSIALAQQQGALSWELRARTTMAQLSRDSTCRALAHDALAAAYGRFNQGLETADLRAARSLLEAFA